MKMGRRPRCSSVTYQFRYAPSTASPARTALPAAHFERNDITIICETVHYKTGVRSSGMASLVLAFHCKRISSCLLAKSRRGGIGRRAGLKIQYWQQCVGSIPSVGKCGSDRRCTSGK